MMRACKLESWSAVAALLVAVTGCGRSEEIGPVGGVAGAGQASRLVLQSDRPPDIDTQIRTTRTMTIGPHTDGYVMRVGSARVIRDPTAEDSDEDWQLLLGPERIRALELTGPFEPQSFQRIALELTIRNYDSIAATAILADGTRYLSSNIGVSSAPSRQAVILDLPHLRLERRPVQKLMLHFRGQAGTRTSVHRIDWLAQPAAGWLPQAGSKPRQLTLGAETRKVIGLIGGERLSARFPVTRGQVLTFGYAVPPGMGHPSRSAQLELRLSRGRRTISESYALPTLAESSHWQDVEISLDDLAGEAVELELWLSSRDRDQAICALTDLRVRDPRAEAPLIFLMTSDTHRADHVGVAGLGVEIHTPVLDALASRGVWFENCFSATNITNPSHATLLTGVHVRDHGVISNTMGLGEQAFTLAQAFRDAGWATFGVVSNASLGPPRGGLEQGFERFAVPALSNPGKAEEAIDRLLEWWPAGAGVPLFCWLHVFDAHEPYRPPDKSLVELYYPAGKDPFDPSLPPIEGLTDEQLPESLKGLRDLAWPRALYRAEITYLDRELGRLLSQPRFDDAIVAFTADHGETLDTSGIYYNHGDLFASNLHVPLILAWPGAPAGSRVPHPVEQAWVGRTLLDLAGLNGVDFPGQDLRAYLTDSPPPARPRFALSANGSTVSVTHWPWHLTLHLREHRGPGVLQTHQQHDVRLFHLERDPDCEHDLAASGEELDRIRRLREILVEWCNSGADLNWVGIHNRSPEVLAELARLGYADDGPTAGGTQMIDPDCPCELCARYR